MDLSPACTSAQAGDRTVAQLIVQAIGCVPFPSPEQARSIERLRGLAGRLVESRLQIAVVGQFKRGKSSLLNALLGQTVLPMVAAARRR